MKMEPQQPTWLRPLGGLILGFTVTSGFLGCAAWLVGVPWLYTVAFVAGTTLLLAPFVFHVARNPPAAGSTPSGSTPAPPVVGGPPLGNPFSGRLGWVAFWVIGVSVVIPTFATVVSGMGQYVVAPLVASALAAWLPPERTAAVVAAFFYLVSLVFGVLFWRAAWREFKPRRGAA
jgi:hypothetical protein